MRGYTDEELYRAYDAVREWGSVSEASRRLNERRTTLSTTFQAALVRLNLPNPTLKEHKFEGFTAYTPKAEKERSLDELLSHRRAEAERSIDYDDAIKTVKIKVHADGPIGLMIFGDPHIDNAGCDFPLLEAHLKIAADNRGAILPGNIGDLRDNWIGRLERLYVDTTVNAKEIWRLVEWMIKGCGVQWAWLTKGNHDSWAGINDPLDWIARQSVGTMQSAGLRISFQHPNSQETRLHARHDFSGNSIYNPLHALKRETLYGFRDHVIVAGHRHIGADAGDVHGDGATFQMVRVSGYKRVDSFRHEKGLHAKPIHPSALVIIDPDLPETERGRAFCAPSVEEGADYLKFKRERWNARARPKAKAKRT